MRLSPTALISLVLALPCLAIPINITTYNYITYDVSRFFYLNSDSKNIDFSLDFDTDLNNYFDLADHGSLLSAGLTIKAKSLLLLSDTYPAKLNHDYNNVLYCLIKYLKKLDRRKDAKLLKLDRDLINFVRMNRSTDKFLEKMVKRADVQRILSNFKHLKSKRLSTDLIIDAEKLNALLGWEDEFDEQRHDYSQDVQKTTSREGENYVGFNFEQDYSKYSNETMNINLVHLYHLAPNISDTFEYQVFHNLKFGYPNLDDSINNSVKYLLNDNSILKAFVNMLSEFTNTDYQISFSTKKLVDGTTVFNNVQVTKNEQSQQLPILDVKLQLNILILVNVAILCVKLTELFTGNNILSFQRLLFFA